MEYSVHVISSPAKLEQCELFQVDHFLWTCRIKPRTYGRLGFIPGFGLFLRMVSMEIRPLRHFRTHGDPVAHDSAMEFFLAPHPDDNGLYLNFEVNPNGAMYAKYGHGRKNRKFIDTEEYEACRVRSEVWPDFWTMELLVPLSLLEKVGFGTFCIDGDPGRGQLGESFYCNFYKISENPSIEHYGAFCPIPEPEPNFHLPRFFAQATIKK